MYDYMLIRVKAAEYVSDFKIQLRFSDDSIKIVDLADELDGPIFEPLMDVQYFKNFTVNPDLGTITWPNEADFAPSFLYEIGQPVELQQSA